MTSAERNSRARDGPRPGPAGLSGRNPGAVLAASRQDPAYGGRSRDGGPPRPGQACSGRSASTRWSWPPGRLRSQPISPAPVSCRGGRFRGRRRGGRPRCIPRRRPQGCWSAPFAWPGMHSLACAHGQLAGLGLHDQRAVQDDRELIELRPLPWFSPAGRAAHVRDAQPLLPVFARPTYSSISFGGSPAAATRLGRLISSGMPASIPQNAGGGRRAAATPVRPRAGKPQRPAAWSARQERWPVSCSNTGRMSAVS